MTVSAGSLSTALALTALAFPAASQELPVLELGEPVRVTLVADGSSADETEPARRFALHIERAGELFVWARAGAFPVRLRLEGADGAALATDDAARRDACLERRVSRPEALVVLVAGAPPAGGGEVELRAFQLYESAVAADAVQTIGQLLELARGEHEAGGREVALGILGEALAILQDLGDEWSPGVLNAVARLGALASELSDFATCAAAWAVAAELVERTHPALHPEHARPRLEQASALYSNGEYARAHALFEPALALCERTLPPEHPDRVGAVINGALCVKALGDYERARELELELLALEKRTHPPGHLEIQHGRMNLAQTLARLDDLHGAHALNEAALEVLLATYPDDHMEVQRARTNLSIVKAMLGDAHGARELQEQALEICSRSFPPDHPILQQLRTNLALTLRELGELEPSRALHEEALASSERVLPPAHPRLARQRMDLGNTLLRMGEVEEARRLYELGLTRMRGELPDAHPIAIALRRKLAYACAAAGELERAVELAHEITRLRATSPGGEEVSLDELSLLARVAFLRGDAEELRAQLGPLIAIERAALRETIGRRAPRELEAWALDRRDHWSFLLTAALGAGSPANGAEEQDPESLQAVFEVVEGGRSLGVAVSWVANASGLDPELAALRAAERRDATALAGLVRAGAERDALAAARTRLDRSRRERVTRLARLPEVAARLVDPTVEALVDALPADTALVTYTRYRPWSPAIGGPSDPVLPERFVAHVVRADGGFARVDVGAVDAIAAAVEAWRASLGIAGERGVAPGIQPESTASERQRGGALRALVLDPVLPETAGVERVIVIADDVLHLVPLDALPLGDGLVGERFEVEVRTTARELVWELPALSEDGVCVTLGAVPFGVSESRALTRDERFGAAFAPLPGTGPEARGVAALYTAQGLGEALMLAGARATRAELESAVPSARVLHLATHGWFAPESVPSTADPRPVDAHLGLGELLRADEQVNGSAPMLLCGLALADANATPDELGRVDGLVTAEELASWDLSGCRLAVLSACDTNVGVRRAGLGVASLQQALHMAGARSVITSLWKVPDEATKELMLAFYRRMWEEGEPAGRALWNAKAELRAREDADGRPLYSTRDWAAWVLTGAPE